MMNWRIVADHAPLGTRLFAASHALRRLAPLTLVALGVGLLALARLLCRRLKRKAD